MKRYGPPPELASLTCLVELRDGDWVRFSDVEAVEAEREAEYERGRKEESRLATARCREIVAKVEVERDALKAEVERLKAERTQDVSIRREQCEALADSERGMFAAIDRHQMAAAEVERLRAALCEIAAGEHVQTSAAVAREALEKK